MGCGRRSLSLTSPLLHPAVAVRSAKQSFAPLTWSYSLPCWGQGTTGPSSRSSSGAVITRVTVSLGFCLCFLARPFYLQTARWATDPESKSVKIQRQCGWYAEPNRVCKERSIQLRRVWGFFKDSPVFSHCAFDKIEWVCIIFKIMAGTVVAKKSAY